jgi:hypothetical protein
MLLPSLSRSVMHDSPQLEDRLDPNGESMR